MRLLPRSRHRPFGVVRMPGASLAAILLLSSCASGLALPQTTRVVLPGEAPTGHTEVLLTRSDFYRRFPFIERFDASATPFTQLEGTQQTAGLYVAAPLPADDTIYIVTSGHDPSWWVDGVRHHEEGHLMQHRYSWALAKPYWEWVERYAPSEMTHPEITKALHDGTIPPDLALPTKTP